MVKEMNPHYSIENTATIFDEEAMTSLQLAGRTVGKVNELVKAFNQLDADTASRLAGIPEDVKQEVQRHIDNGEFAQAIDAYVGGLQAQVDNLLGAVSAGSVSTALDAELVDIRHDSNGINWKTAGEAVRAFDDRAKAHMKNVAIDFKYVLDWKEGNAYRSLSTRGQLVELDKSDLSNRWWHVVNVDLPRGTRVDFELYVTANSCAVATAPLGATSPVSGVALGNAQNTPTKGSYTVKEEWETVFFMCDIAYIADAHIWVTFPKSGGLLWNMGYISSDGAFTDEPAKLHAYSDIIEVPPHSILTADLQVSSSVGAIAEVYADNTEYAVQVLCPGENGNQRKEYFYINATEETKLVRVSTRVNAMWDDDSVDKTFFNDVVVQVKPYTDKYRVPTFTVGNGHINVAESNVKNDSVYMYSDMIRLFPGETIRFPSSGTSSAWLLSEWYPVERTFAHGLVRGDAMFRWVEYTNDTPDVMHVRTCAKKVPSSVNDNVVTEAEFKDVRIYDKKVYYADVMTHPLYGKKLALFGDSLFAGNNSGTDITWWRLLAHKYNMTTEFYGGNGFTLTNGTKADAGSIYEEMESSYTGSADYCVVIGGANDLRVGETVADFKTTVRLCAEYLREQGDNKILFMTNMNRFGSTNSIGANEKDYADAMLEVCEDLCVPCFDNYRKLGVYFRDTNMAKWCDEGNVKAFAYDGSTNPTAHLSRAGYEWVLPVYESLLVGL